MDKPKTDPVPQKITLNRYLNRRRPAPKSRIAQIASIVAMLAMLTLVFLFKDRCGQSVSHLFQNVAPSSESSK